MKTKDKLWLLILYISFTSYILGIITNYFNIPIILTLLISLPYWFTNIYIYNKLTYDKL